MLLPDGDHVTQLSQNWHLYSIKHSLNSDALPNAPFASSVPSIDSIYAQIILHVPSKLAEAITLPFGLNSQLIILDLCCFLISAVLHQLFFSSK